MGLKQYAFNSEEQLIEEIDTVVKDSKSKYKDRTQFIILAIQEKLEREKNEKD